MAAPAWLHRRTRWLIAALGVALFFTPLAARLAGVQPRALENRPLVGLPSLSRGFGIFDVLTQWSIDHLPLRSAAVRINSRISTSLFGEPPTYTVEGGPVGLGASAPLAGGRTGELLAGGLASVIPGRDGWLFIADEFIHGCQSDFAPSELVAALRRLAAVLTASGRRVVFLLPPDKDTVDGRFVAPGTLDAACARAGKAARYAALDGAGLRDLVDLRGSLAALERTTGRPAYLPDDTHWSSRAAATVFVPALVRALAPGLLAGTRIAPSAEQSYLGDLEALTGGTRPGRQTVWTVTRPGVTVAPASITAPFANFPISRFTALATPGRPLVRSRVLLYGDSFAERSLPDIAPFFADLTRVPEVSRALAGHHRTQAITAVSAAVARADVLVVVQTERIVAGTRAGSILAPDVIDAIAAAVARAPRGHGLALTG